MPADAHVCHVSTLTRWGGIERMLLDFLEHTLSSPMKHSVLHTSSAPAVLGAFQSLSIPTFQPLRRFHYDPRAIWQMAAWLRSHQVQVVHAYNAKPNAWGSLAALLAGDLAFIGGEHGSVWSSRPPLSWLNRWAYQRARFVVVNSQATRTMVRRKYGVVSEKIRIVYNTCPPLPPADLGQIRAELGLDGEFIVGSVGRLAPEKGFATFVAAARHVLQRRRDIKFVLVGGGEQKEQLQKLVQEWGMEDRFLLTGQRDDARRVMQVFDVFVSTSLWETFGNVLAEAAMAAKPVVAPRVDGIPEVVKDGLTGILLTPSQPFQESISSKRRAAPKQVLIDGRFSPPRSLDPVDLAEAILHLVDAPALRNQYGQAGRAWAQEMFSIERYATELEGVYIEAMEG